MKNDHSTDEPVYYTKYNQVKIYRATAEGGTYVLKTTEDIKWGQDRTYYDDTAASSTDYCQTTLYNDVSDVTSSESDEVPYAGFSFDRVGKLIERARRKTGTLEDYTLITDDQLIDALNEVEDHLTRIGDWNEGETETTDSTVDSQQAYSLPDDYKQGSFFKMKFTDDTDISYPKYLTWHEFCERYTNSSNESTKPTHYTIYGGSYYLYPIPVADGADNVTLYHQKDPTDLEGENDVTTYPWTDIYVYKLRAEIESAKGNETQSDKWISRYEGAIGEVMALDQTKQRDKFGTVRQVEVEGGLQLGRDPDEITMA